MIAAILLVPAEGDPHGLLAEGPCGARPPMAWLRGRRDGIWRPAPWFPDEREPLWALVLAWDGKPARVNIYIAGIALGRLDVVGHGVHCALQGGHTGGVRWASNHLAEVGTFALLDAEGRAVKDSPAKGPQQEKTP